MAATTLGNNTSGAWMRRFLQRGNHVMYFDLDPNAVIVIVDNNGNMRVIANTGVRGNFNNQAKLKIDGNPKFFTISRVARKGQP